MRPIIVLIALILLFLNSCIGLHKPASPNNDIHFSDCINVSSLPKTLEIVTFNLKTFPANGSSSINAAAALLRDINADIYALQEIGSRKDFDELVNSLEGYSGLYYLIDNSQWNLSYIYKTSEVTIDPSSIKLIFKESYYFPRPAFEIKIAHKRSNLDIVLINNHLKCCDGSSNFGRRREASKMLRDHVMQNLPDDRVIILGDLNDDINGTTSSENPFTNFIEDSNNFKFADMEIALGDENGWSYPSYPSHIDHIIITNELFNNVDTTIVYNVSSCYSGYFDNISDHLPVGIIIQ